MKLETPSKVAEIEYTLAPWHLRVRWWLLAGFWRLADLFAPIVDEAPEQQNPLWRR